MASTVLVTGGSGFIASHLILQLLSAGHTVRTTIRSAGKADTVRQTLQSADASVPLDKLSFFTADLTKDDGWTEALTGVEYVHHLASPFPSDDAKSDDEIIVPARDGTLRVLKAAKAAGVKRVVLTSSFAAIAYGHSKKDTFTEQDWSVDKDLPPFHRSKLLAEKAAWEFVKENGNQPELTVIAAVGVLGPVLSAHVSSGVGVIKSLLDGSLPGCPRLYNNFVDVRDLATLHISAMTNPKAGGERFIASDSGEPRPLLDVANIVRSGRPDKSAKVPTKQLPDWTVKATALAAPKLKGLIPQLGVKRTIKSSKTKDTFGWSTRKVEDTIIDTVDALFKQGVV
jgi:dihydroflavonol-4-reductase